MMIQTLRTSLNSYVNELPRNTLKAMLASGVSSFAVSSLIRRDLRIGAIVGGVAVTASLIDALVTPLFKKIIGGNQAQYYQRALHFIVTLSLTQAVLRALTPLRIDLVSQMIFGVGITLGLSCFDHEKNLDQSSSYLIV